MKRRGFTLIEILVVISILAIIALIAIPTILVVVKKNRTEVAKDNAVIYLRTIENYMVLHKVKPDKYPFEFEPGKTYTVEEIKKILGNDVKSPESGEVSISDGTNIDNASIKIDGYEITCTSSGTCEVGEKPVIHIIIPDGWDTEKVIEIIVVKPGSGLDKEPFSYDGGNTWTDEDKKTITENGEIDIKIKDKNGKEVEDVYFCTKKVNGHGEDCHKINDGEDDGKKGNNNSGKIVINSIDNIAPTCELEIKGTQGVNGYYSSDIEAKISKMNDTAKNYYGEVTEGSGIKSSNINYTKITEDGTYEIVGTVVDNAGNKGTCKAKVTKDTKKPTVEVTVDGTTRSDGYESGAKVVIKCTDETGKISYQTPDVILNGGGSKTVTATCKDNAGNEVTTSKTYNVYEYSSNSTCGYKSCASSSCGTATGTRSTGGRVACGSYECGTKTCTGSVSSTCYKTTSVCIGCKRVLPVTEPDDELNGWHSGGSSSGGSSSGGKIQIGDKNCSGGYNGVGCKAPTIPIHSFVSIEKTCDPGTTCVYATTQTPYSCTKSTTYSCPKYCTSYCDETETYTYNKTCATSACGSQTCWHK